MSRRWKIVKVNSELLSHMLMTGVKPAVEVRDGLPPTATFDGEWYDPLTGTFHLRFHDESFPEVPEGHCLPTAFPSIHKATESQQLADAFNRGMKAATTTGFLIPGVFTRGGFEGDAAPAVVEARP